MANFNEETQSARLQQEKILQHLEQEKKARQLAVPTNDAHVRARLRELGEPICLFGEDAPERRQRLRLVMVQQGVTEAMPSSALHDQAVAAQAEAEKKQVYYTPGTSDLKEFRLWALAQSLPRAKERIAGQKRRREEKEATSTEVDDKLPKKSRVSTAAAIIIEQMQDLGKFGNFSSQVGDTSRPRPLSSVSLSPDGSTLATSSWSGSVKLWDVETSEERKLLRGHTERVNYVVYHPDSGSKILPSNANLFSCGADSSIHLWSLESDTPIATLSGHADRVNRLDFHPLGRHIGSTSHDMTWRLWDIESQKMLLEQEGHSKATFGISFHPDGSLVCTTGLDSFGRIWDLRSGKSIFVLKGHVQTVMTTDWSADGHTLVTGGDDHTVRVWDLRRKRCVYTIPAHSNVVSQVKFHGKESDFLATASFDHTVKLWSSKDWTLIHTLIGHEGQVSGVDISNDGLTIASAGYDKTWKLWRRQD